MNRTCTCRLAAPAGDDTRFDSRRAAACRASAACADAALGVGSGRTILLAQLTVNRGTTFTGHVNVQGRRPDGGSWQEHGVCFSIGKGCTKHPRHDEV